MVAKFPMTWAYHTSSYTGNPVLAPGVAVTGGFSNADGTAVAVLGTALTHDVELLEINISAAIATALTTVDTSAFFDIIIDRAGGTAWDTTNIFIEGLQYGFMPAQTAVGSLVRRTWRFPVWLPAGTTVAAVGRSVVASGNTIAEISMEFYGGPSHPNQWWCGQKIDAIGINRAGSNGTLITPNATLNTYGSWTSVGAATARRYGCLIPSIQIASAAVTGTVRQLQVGISSLQIPGSPTFTTVGATSEQHSDFAEDKRIFVDVPEGTQLQARNRINAGSGTADSIIIHGVA